MFQRPLGALAGQGTLRADAEEETENEIGARISGGMDVQGKAPGSVPTPRPMKFR